MATLGVPQNTIEILKKHNIKFQKKFGQNFLIDTHVLEKIVSAAGITEDDFVLEIGPGIGTMTQYLCENAREVMAVEIDKSLIPVLSETLSSYNNVTVINKDILKTDINKIRTIVQIIFIIVTIIFNTLFCSFTSFSFFMLSFTFKFIYFLNIFSDMFFEYFLNFFV